MGKKPVVKLRIFRGSQMSYDKNGNVQNENQLVTLIHDTVEWANYLKRLTSNQFLEVMVEKVFYCDKEKNKDGFFEDKISEVDQETIDEIKQEVKEALKAPEKELTPQEKQIAELKAQVEALMKGQTVKKETKSEKKVEKTDDLDELRAEYETLYGKKPFGSWKADKLKEKIAEKQ